MSIRLLHGSTAAALSQLRDCAGETSAGQWGRHQHSPLSDSRRILSVQDRVAGLSPGIDERLLVDGRAKPGRDAARCSVWPDNALDRPRPAGPWYTLSARPFARTTPA